MSRSDLAQVSPTYHENQPTQRACSREVKRINNSIKILYGFFGGMIALAITSFLIAWLNDLGININGWYWTGYMLLGAIAGVVIGVSLAISIIKQADNPPKTCPHCNKPLD